MAVRLILSVVVGLALSLSPAAYAMKQLELKSHSHIAAIDIPLSGKEKAWLAAQPKLTVGTWLPERTPIVYDGDEKSYQGINADYLALMAHSLGLKVIIRQYDRRSPPWPTARWIPCSLRWRTGMRSPRAWINPRRCLKPGRRWSPR